MVASMANMYRKAGTRSKNYIIRLNYNTKSYCVFKFFKKCFMRFLESLMTILRTEQVKFSTYKYE